MICGYEFVDGAVCMQAHGHRPTAGVPHVHPDDVTLKPWSQCSHEGTYFELRHQVAAAERSFRERWDKEVEAGGCGDAVDFELECLEREFDHFVETTSGMSSKDKAKASIEFHYRFMRFRDNNRNNLTREQSDRMITLMKRLMRDGFQVEPKENQ